MITGRGSRTLDLTGKRHGFLIALQQARQDNRGSWYWLCQCDCGNKTEVRAANFFRIGSCGCRQGTFRHGHANTPIYKVWTAMLQRCRNPKCVGYADYGGRGITVCERWLTFDNFLEDMGERPPDTEIERIDNCNGYSKDNCKWATRTQQTRNTRQNHFIEWNGQTKCLTDWAKELGISFGALRKRIRTSKNLSEVFTRPFGNGKFLTFNGQTKHIKSWAIFLGIEAGTIASRLRKGWPVEKALNKSDFRL